MRLRSRGRPSGKWSVSQRSSTSASAKEFWLSKPTLGRRGVGSYGEERATGFELAITNDAPASAVLDRARFQRARNLDGKRRRAGCP